MIPIYPEFKSIDITDQADIREFTSKYPPYSNFHFTTLFCWDIHQQRRISLLNGNLVVRTTDDLSGETFYTFLGDNKALDTINTLFGLCRKEGLKQVLKLIPQETTNNFAGSEGYFKIREDRDNFDHVYELQRLADYPGPEYAQARNLLSRFKKRHGQNYCVKCFELHNDQDKKHLTDVWHSWNTVKEAYIEKEEIAIARLLSNAMHFSLVNIMIFVDDKPAAFTINQIIDGEYAISHFAKANYEFSGITAALMNETGKELVRHGCKYLNYEEDMGLKKLRQAKESYRPVFFKKKFVVERKDLLKRLFSMLYSGCA